MHSLSGSTRSPSRTLAGAALLLVLGTVPVLVPLVAIREVPPAGPGQAGTDRRADPPGGQVAPVGPGPSSVAAVSLAPLTSVRPVAVPATSGPPDPAPAVPTPRVSAPPTTRVAGTPAPPPDADLAVTGVFPVPDRLRRGSGVTFAATVRNVGTAATPAGSPDIVFVLDGVPVSWSRSDTSALRPGEERRYVADGGPVSATWTATRGRHRLVVIVDAGDRLAERDEGDNTAAVAFRVR